MTVFNISPENASPTKGPSTSKDVREIANKENNLQPDKSSTVTSKISTKSKPIEQHQAYHSSAIETGVRKMYEEVDRLAQENNVKPTQQQRQELISKFNRDYCDEHFKKSDPEKKESLFLLRDSSQGTSKVKTNDGREEEHKTFALSTKKAGSDRVTHYLIYKVSGRIPNKDIYVFKTQDKEGVEKEMSSRTADGLVNKMVGQNFKPSPPPSDSEVNAYAVTLGGNYYFTLRENKDKHI
jgi:hypothetical protein